MQFKHQLELQPPLPPQLQLLFASQVMNPRVPPGLQGVESHKDKKNYATIVAKTCFKSRKQEKKNQGQETQTDSTLTPWGIEREERENTDFQDTVTAAYSISTKFQS